MSTRIERLSVELVLRYCCATMVTLLAAAGAQLVVRTDFVAVVMALSVVGAVVSLYLRVHGMRVAGVTLPRPLWNAFTSLAWFVAAILWTVSSLSDVIGILLSGGGMSSFWVRFSAGDSLALLMQVFLLFSAFRSFALITDKDATLSTVPSFSVLLLLIPVHKGIEVVLYFLAWTLTATCLFALDHRSELKRSVDGRIPAALPGQDVRMAARGLATVLASALVAAFALSYFLTSGDPDSRSSAQNAITGLAGRLAQFALQSSSDGSGAQGPQRQIDFSSGPALPSKALLWRARIIALDGELLRPQYFRLFTLSHYTGSTWTQDKEGQKRLAKVRFTRKDWPVWKSQYLRFPGHKSDDPDMPQIPLENDPVLPHGFVVRSSSSAKASIYGFPTRAVKMRTDSNANNLGFAPLLPGTRALVLPKSNVEDLRVRADGGVDLGFVGLEEGVRSLSDMPNLVEYGGSATPPTQVISTTPDAPQLSREERARYTEIPPLSARVRDFAQRALSSTKAGDSSYRRAQRLAFAVQNGATYTLRPPNPPQNTEATDYFLFEGQKRGYCTHFASALTVLCRSQGIPARIVSGFAANEYDDRSQALLRDANAHAWTEVWVENWGWAPVDATPAEDRGDNAPNWLSLWGEWASSMLVQIAAWSRARIVLLGFATCWLVAGIYAFRRRARIRAWWAGRARKVGEAEWSRREVIAAYEEATLELTRQFRPRALAETPDEWLEAATAFARQEPRPIELPLRQLRELTAIYSRARYAPQAPDNSLVVVAREIARRLSWKKPRRSDAAR